MAIVKRQIKIIVEDVEKLNISCRNVKWCNYFGKEFGDFLKYIKHNYTVKQERNSTPRNENMCTQTCMQMVIIALEIAKIWKYPISINW